MQMERIKGRIEAIDKNSVTVVADKSGEEYRFSIGEFSEPVKGEKVDLLCAPSDNQSGLFRVISIKSRKKIKPLRMPNFSTLLGHMIKTRDRLQATVDEAPDSDYSSELNEKIAWLERGIRLFS